MTKSFIKWYKIEDIDVSKLPLPVRKGIDNYPKATHVGWSSASLSPKYSAHLGMYKEFWALKISDEFLSIVQTPWVSPRIWDYLEMIRTDKEENN